MHTHDEYCNSTVVRKVAYEFDMFADLGERLVREHQKLPGHIPGDVVMMSPGDCATDELAVRCALLESFLLHANVLIEFFYKDRPRDGDVLASHFLEHWKVLRPPESRYFLDHKHHLDRALGHLTLARVDWDRRQRKWGSSGIRALCL